MRILYLNKPLCYKKNQYDFDKFSAFTKNFLFFFTEQEKKEKLRRGIKMFVKSLSEPCRSHINPHAHSSAAATIHKNIFLPQYLAAFLY